MPADLLLQVSMSSTSIVVKCLTDTKATNSPHGQITIGTLILQVCSSSACTETATLHSRLVLWSCLTVITAEHCPLLVKVLRTCLCTAGLHGGAAVRLHARAGRQQRP